MIPSNKTNLLVGLLAGIVVLVPLEVIAQDFHQRMASAVDRHENAAPRAEHELSLVRELSKLSVDDPNSWLPDYWAAYFLTQVTMSHEDDRDVRLQAAQEHLNEAASRMLKITSAPIADLHALQSLIHVFELNELDEEEGQARNKITKLLDAETQTAYEINPHSPVVMVIAGTTLIREGSEERSWPKVMGGQALLQAAKLLFEQDERPKGLTSHFNAEWIDPWSGWAITMFEDGFDPE